MHCDNPEYPNSAIHERPRIFTGLISVFSSLILKTETHLRFHKVSLAVTINHPLFEQTRLCSFGFLSVQAIEDDSII